MSTRYAPWSLRSWLIVAAIVVPYVVVKETFGITYPSWVQWICIGVAGLVGGAMLVSPDLASMRSPTMARILGAVMVIAAAFAAYTQFTKISVE